MLFLYIIPNILLNILFKYPIKKKFRFAYRGSLHFCELFSIDGSSLPRRHRAPNSHRVYYPAASIVCVGVPSLCEKFTGEYQRRGDYLRDELPCAGKKNSLAPS